MARQSATQGEIYAFFCINSENACHPAVYNVLSPLFCLKMLRFKCTKLLYCQLRYMGVKLGFSH
jgi:hypothetical protein